MRQILFLIGGGVLGGVAVSVPQLWLLIFLVPLPLLHTLYQEKSLKSIFLSGWLFGTVLVATSVYWFFNTLPLDWLGVSGSIASALMVMMLWGALSILLGLAVGAWAVVVRFLVSNTALDFLVISVSWVLFEYLRMWLYAIVTYGPGALIEPHFSFAFLGYPLAHGSLLLPFAKLGGVYALSLVVMLAATSVYFLLFQKQKRASVIVVATIIFFTVTLTLHSSNEQEISLNIEAIETNFPATLTLSPDMLLQRQGVLRKEITTLAKESPEIEVLVLPESSRFIQNLGEENAKSFFGDLFGEREVLVVDSWRVDERAGSLNKMVFFSSTKGILAEQDKRFLLVFGEYMPSAGELLLRLAGRGEEVESLKKNRSYKAVQNMQPFTFKGVQLATLTCSELVSPWLYHSLAKEGSTVLINPVSLAWFHGGDNPRNQLIAMAKVHAVWNGLSYIQSANGAASFKVNASGVVEE